LFFLIGTLFVLLPVLLFFTSLACFFCSSFLKALEASISFPALPLFCEVSLSYLPSGRGDIFFKTSAV
jgi:hypothetical protein